MPTNNTDQTVFTLMSQVINNDKLDQEQKIKLLDEIRKSQPALQDRWIYRWVVYFLGGTLIFTVFVILHCLNNDIEQIPDGLIALGSGALGALSGLLSNRPKSEGE